MKKWIGYLLLTVLLSGLWTLPNRAAEGIIVKSVQDGEEYPGIFVGGIDGEIYTVTAIVGSQEAKEVQITPIRQEEISMRTLILLDNSLSIPGEERERMNAIVTELIAGRMEGEQFLLATFGEEMESLTAWTDDYGELKEALESITFVDRETYLTDVLYPLLAAGMDKGEERAYYRCIVLSDGVDNKALGYTQEELVSLLKQERIPLYTIGIYNKTKSNEDELKNMFALSRMSGAESFLLSEVEEKALLEALEQDRNVVRLDIIPPAAAMDGSKKTITLKLETSSGEVSLQVDDVRMAQRAEQVATKEAVQESEDTPVLEPMKEKEANQPKALLFIILGAVVLLLILSGVAFILARIIRKKKQASLLRETQNPFTVKENREKTEFVEENPHPNRGEGETLLLFQTEGKRRIILTDMQSPTRSFQQEIIGRLVIGRAEAKTDICIDYDKSVSSCHCAIEKRGSKYYLVDLQSSNGTFLNDSRVLSEVEIYSGAIIRLGRVKLKVEIG